MIAGFLVQIPARDKIFNREGICEVSAHRNDRGIRRRANLCAALYPFQYSCTAVVGVSPDGMTALAREDGLCYYGII